MVGQAESGSTGSTGQGPAHPQSGAIPEVLTFLFADVRGYSTFASQRGDAAAALLAQKFADLARDAVEARSGRVLELRGDEVFAVFGSAAQAVRAAVELQATFAEESQLDPMFQLPVGIGIDTGEAVPVEGGYRGVAVNMAARLCSTAAAGQVLVTRILTDHVGATEDVVFAERGPATFKGFDDPVDVIEALPPLRPTGDGPTQEAIHDLSVHASEWRAALRTDESPTLVGREHEMRWARGTWRQVRRGNGRVVCVSGPSEIGKTRLAAEIASYVDEAGGSVRYSAAGGTALADALNAVHAARVASTPTLVILDDIDAAGPELADAVADAFDTIAGLPSMVLMNAQRPQGLPELGTLLERIDVHGDGHRPLSPLGQDAVREIGRTYLGDDVELAPLEAFFRSSGGVPGRVHEVVSGWAREEATRRLSAAAEWLVAGRNRRANDLEFANNVLGLKLDQLFRAPDIGAQEGVDVCPYKGLATFRQKDAALFFGRERLVGELAARSVDVGLLGVIGSSGSGKSSVVAAGLCPSLAAGLLPGSERWLQVSVRPGEHPMAELHGALGPRAVGDVDDPVSRALARSTEGRRLVLVVDQLEETFTTCTDEHEREAFIDVLTRSATADPDRLVVVAILRADFYGRCATYPGFAALLGENHILLGPMSKDDLRRTIELPARRTGLRVESRLTERLVEDVVDEPGGLPLLSTALVELWQRREDGWLRAEMYEQTGGVYGAVARLAESSYAHLSDAEQAAARRVFQRLVIVGDDDVISKRRVALREFDLDEDQPAAALVARLSHDRLLTVSDEAIEVSHEALLREWPRLRGWLEEDREGQRLHLRLVQAANTWDESGRADEELLRGATLASVMDWSADHASELNELERTFVGSSRGAAELEAERQRRTNRRLRGLLIGVAAFLVIALVAGSLAVAQRSRARAADRAATAQRLGAQALQQDDLDLKLLLSRQGVALDDSPVTARNAALLSSPAAIKVVHPLPGVLTKGILTPNGSEIAVGTDRNTGVLVDTSTFENVKLLPGEVWYIGRDGRALVDTPGVGTMALVDPNGHRVDLDRAFSGSDRALWVDPSMSELAVVDAHGAGITFWDTSDATRTGRLPAPHGQVFVDVYYTPDGRHLVTIQQGGSQLDLGRPMHWVLRDPVTRAVEGELPNTPEYPYSYKSSPDGRWMAFGFSDGTVWAVNVATGKKIVMHGRHDAGVGSVAIAPDDRTLVSGSDDKSIKVWDLRTGQPRETLTGHVSVVTSVAISPDGRTLYSTSLDGSMIVWDLAGSRRLGRPFPATSGGIAVRTGGYPPVPHLVAVSPTGELFATPQCDGQVVIHDATTLGIVHTIPVVKPLGACGQPDPPDLYRQPYDVAFTPDGESIVVGATEGSVTMWDARTGRPIGPTFSGPSKWINDAERGQLPDAVEAVAVSPDGGIVAAGTDEGRIYLWDASTGVPLRSPIQVPKVKQGGTETARNWVFDLAFAADGSMLAAGHGSAASVWATSDWSLKYTVPVDEGVGAVYSVGFSRDGRTLAAAGGTNSLGLWDAESGTMIGSVPVDTTFTVSLSWSPDSSTIVTGGWDGSIKLVDVATRSVIGSLPGPADLYNTVAFAPDGRHIFVVYEETGRGIRWTFDAKKWADRACEVAGRTLTQDEWNRFLPGLSYDPACVSTS